MEHELIELLDTVICKVFDNEERFMKEVYRPEKEWDGELLEFYMASESCRLTILLECGQHITDTVKTGDVLDWVSAMAAR